ncbi:MAG: hypothetical protein ACE5G5_05560 [Candidatus Methylomirabilales bacterium]
MSVSGGTGGVGVSGSISPAYDPVMNSTMMGAAIGALGGPIGLGVGALFGYLHGLNERSRLEQQAKTEVDRQAQIDKQLEKQIEAKRKEAGQRSSHGIITLEDHLARGGTKVTSVPPAASPSSEGYGLSVLADNLTPAKPKGSPPAQTEKSSPGLVTEAHASEGDGTEKDEAQRALEAQIAAAREQQEKLLKELQVTAAIPKTPRASRPAPAPRPTIDPEGFRPVYEGGRLVRKERDVNGDKLPDVIRTYDETGKLVRQDEDSRLDGQMDTWTYYENGHPARKESDTNGDGRVDLWAYYSGAGDVVRTEADTDHDRHRDRVVAYSKGEMVEEKLYIRGQNSPRLIVTYRNGQPSRKVEDTSGNGRIDRVTEYDGAGHITKVSRVPSDKGDSTVVQHFEPETGDVLREEEDLNGDKTIDVISYYEKGRLVRREFFDLPEIASLKSRAQVPKLPSATETP